MKCTLLVIIVAMFAAGCAVPYERKPRITMLQFLTPLERCGKELFDSFRVACSMRGFTTDGGELILPEDRPGKWSIHELEIPNHSTDVLDMPFFTQHCCVERCTLAFLVPYCTDAVDVFVKTYN